MILKPVDDKVVNAIGFRMPPVSARTILKQVRSVQKRPQRQMRGVEYPPGQVWGAAGS